MEFTEVFFEVHFLDKLPAKMVRIRKVFGFVLVQINGAIERFLNFGSVYGFTTVFFVYSQLFASALCAPQVGPRKRIKWSAYAKD